MRANLFGTAACVLGFAAAAPAQYPVQPGAPAPAAPPAYTLPPVVPPQYPPINPANVMPNIYNPRTQPLSPYLNLSRAGNPAVNYYYGVRPGTVGGAASPGGAPNIAMGGNRAAFFPQLAANPDPFALPGEDPGAVLPPAGHPVVFNNTLGYFPGGFGGRGSRPGLAGLGTSRPAGQRR